MGSCHEAVSWATFSRSLVMLESLESGISISYQLKLSGFVLCLALLWGPIYTPFGFFFNEVTLRKKRVVQCHGFKVFTEIKLQK